MFQETLTSQATCTIINC